MSAALLTACSAGRVKTLSRAPVFRAKVLAAGGVRGAQGRGAEILKALSARLEGGGTRLAVLEESDSVLAGTSLGLEEASNPRLLAEISRATEAEALLFLSLDSAWSSLDVVVLDLHSGESVLRAAARPQGEAFASPAEVSDAAAEALAGLFRNKPRAAPGDPSEEIPVP